MAKQTFTTGQVLTAAQMTSLQQTAMGGGAATAKTASYVLVAADAGTTVAMNAAGATTITVNTGLFAAGDTVFIQNLGAGACTVTAGTATVATAGSLILPQNDAGILYFTATGTAIFYDYIQAGAVSPLTTKGDVYTFSTSDARLAVGANNTVLTADSAQATGLKWATPGGSTLNWVLVNSGGTALSGSSTQITGLSGYDNIMVLVAQGSYTTASQGFYMRVNENSTADVYSRYGFRISYDNTYSASMGSVFATTSAQIQWASMSNNAASNVSGGITITGCKGTGLKAYTLLSGSTASGGNGNETVGYQGVINSTTAISSIEIIGISATFDAGTVYVYGA